MSNRKDPSPPANPKVRASLYGVGALYLAYLYCQIAWPFLTHDPYGPSAGLFALGTVILGGGAAALALLAWRVYKQPQPEQPPEEDGPPEDGGTED